ncbi:MAG TPA: hypothetical protein PKD27_14360, partial [Tepidiformaceae bacterium]|nr:hypothetical protein [Tepidiformaceae bacterium]
MARLRGSELEQLSRLTPAQRGRLANEMEAALRIHVRDAWFPRCIDRERGGYFCDFDRRWSLAG